jgi:hypothetical protein
MKCKNCQEKEAIKYSKYSTGEFCSKECSHAFGGNSVKGNKKVKCNNCGKEDVVDKRNRNPQYLCDSCCSKQTLNNRIRVKILKQNPKMTTLNEYKRQKQIRDWKDGKIKGNDKSGVLLVNIRKYIFKKYDNKCCKCGWSETNSYTKKIPLQIHHKNGNSEKSDEENLDLLCPNCHSLTPTFGSLNNGKGRKNRYRANQ